MNKDIFTQIEQFSTAKEYWLNKLSAELKEVKLPEDFPEGKLYSESQYQVSFGSELSKDLTRIAKNNDLSLYIILLTCFKILLFKYTGQNDILVGSPIYNLSYQEYNKCVALRDLLHGEMTFKDLLMKVSQTVVEGYKNGHFPIRDIIKSLGIEEDLWLFRFVLLFENIHEKEISRDIRNRFTNDITISVLEENDLLNGEIIYNAKLFKIDTIQRLLNCYLLILKQITRNASIKISDIDLMTGEEKNKILFQFNRRGKYSPEIKPIHELLEMQVEKTPENIAVSSTLELINIYDEAQPEKIDIHLSFQELNDRAHQLARVLREKGVEADTIVGIMAQHPLEMVIGIISILKAGGAYLPIDCDYSEKIKNFIFKESNIDLLLAETSLEEAIPRSIAPLSVIFLDDNPSPAQPPTNLKVITHSYNLAYAIFTSGTTGMLKGILIEHKGIVNYTLWRLESYQYTEKDVTVQLLSYCFDGFGSNFYSSLLSGGTLIMVPHAKRLDYEYIKETIKHFAVTNTSLVPGMYEALLDTAREDELKSLRFVVLAGEKSSAHLLKRSREKLPHLALANEYGPTEASVTAVHHSHLDAANPAIIGRPISNTQVYILDSSLKPVPVKVIGEMYIAGPGAARAYLNNPQLTKDKFAPAPFINILKKLAKKTSFGDDTPKERHQTDREWVGGATPLFEKREIMYRTGDLGRWLPDGNIEFFGRMDSQVKIRGYRLELEQIENQLLKSKEIKSVVVTTKENEKGESVICAYIVADRKYDVFELREFLRQELPDYMIPSYFVPLESIPLTANGKINKKALPEPEEIVLQSKHKAPRNHLEHKLAEIWSEVLGIEKDRIGIDSNFFELGGHSLKATIHAAKIHKEFNMNIPLSEMFQLSTIRKLAKYINESSEEEFQSLEAIEKKQCYPLSSAQKRLYILQQMQAENTSNNLPMKILLEGKLDREKFENTFEKLIKRHESFRTSFLMIDENPVQRIHEPHEVKFKIDYHKIPEGEGGSIEKNFVRPFDLSQAPLLRVGLLEIGNEKHILMVDMHHIITDGVSMEIFNKDFIAIYKGEEMPGLRIQYKDFTQWQNKFIESDKIKAQKDYWLKEFEGKIPVLDVPADYQRTSNHGLEGSSLIFDLGKETSAALKKLAQEEDVTLFMVLLALLNVFLFELTRQEDIVIGTPIAGRKHVDLQHTIGFLVGTLALRNYPQGEKKFSHFLQEIKHRILKAYENQDFQFDSLVAELDLPRNANRNPLFDVLFAFENVEMLGGEEANFNIPGLKLKPYTHESTVSRFDLGYAAKDINGNLFFLCEYSTNLFKRERIERFNEYFKEITATVLENKDIRLNEIKISHDLFDQQINIPATGFDF